jgi:predicted ABC-type transport system involved in lysophospholipase L1 biosynthesis ATPase subunit
VTSPVLELSRVTKAYGGLRPLRVDHLSLEAGEQVAIVGLDSSAAEVLVNLATGATLPESGEVRAGGHSTASVTDAAEWLTLADQFGIVSERAVLLEGLSTLQNLALPFSVEIDPMAPDVRAKAEAAATEVGLPPDGWHRPVCEALPAERLRVRLARALAFGPKALLLEHPSATLVREDVPAVVRDIHAIVSARAVASLTLTADQEFAERIAARVLRLDVASGRLIPVGQGWFGRKRRRT